jgi:hypothetical protein
VPLTEFSTGGQFALLNGSKSGGSVEVEKTGSCFRLKTDDSGEAAHVRQRTGHSEPTRRIGLRGFFPHGPRADA